MRYPTLRERLISRLVFDHDSGCLLWTGSKDRYGYGQIRANGTMRKVHKVMWEMFEEPVPDGLHLDHVAARGCHNKHCASIAHLEPVTQRVNLLRGATLVAANAAKTHCDSDHEFDLINTYISPGGSRQCRTCHRDNERERRRRLAQVAAALPGTGE